MKSKRLTAEQQRVLRAVADGKLTHLADMGWFQKGGYRIAGDRNPHPATVRKLIEAKLIRPVAKGATYDRTEYEATPEGLTLLPLLAGRADD